MKCECGICDCNKEPEKAICSDCESGEHMEKLR